MPSDQTTFVSVSTTPWDTSKPRATATILFSCIIATLAGLMLGLDMGSISGSLPFLKKNFDIDDTSLSWVISLTTLSAAMGATLGASFLSSYLGRRLTLVIGALLCVAGSLTCGFAPGIAVIMTGRIMLGLAIGIGSFTAPLYLAEIAPESMRGAMISMFQLMVNIGAFLGFLSDTAFSYASNWRWMLGIVAIPGTLFLLGGTALSESPRWLMMKNRRKEAESVLYKLTDSPETVEYVISEIGEQLKLPQRGWHMFLENRNFRRSVGLGMLLQIVQQLTGINVVMYYAPRIFQHMGYATTVQMWLATAVGLVNVLGTVLAIAVIERLGRKPILLTGFAVMGISLGVVSATMHLGIHSTGWRGLSVAMILLFILGFAMSAGPVIWAICSEIQPLKGRDFGIGFSTFANWTANSAINYSFFPLIKTIGSSSTFLIYASLNVTFILLTLFMVPETKNTTLLHIERNLMAGKPLRHLGH